MGQTKSVRELTEEFDDPDEIRHSLLLAMIPGLGPRTLASLLERFGTAKAVERRLRKTWRFLCIF